MNQERKPRLIEDWKRAYKLWTVRLSAFGVVVMGWFTFWPESVLYLWSAMPIEVRRLLPEQFATSIALLIFAGSAIARLIRQYKK